MTVRTLRLVVVATPGGTELGIRTGRDDQVIVRCAVLAAHYAGIVAALAGPVLTQRGNFATVGCGWLASSYMRQGGGDEGVGHHISRHLQGDIAALHGDHAALHACLL
ncbi:hypothetical protein D3C78_1682410 [compost metagenome]